MEDILKEVLERAEKNIESPDCMSHIGGVYRAGYICGVKDLIKMIRDAYGCDRN